MRPSLSPWSKDSRLKGQRDWLFGEFGYHNSIDLANLVDGDRNLLRFFAGIMSEVDDAKLMQQVQDGHLEVFEQLVARYRRPLLRVACSKLGDRATAEDTVQEAFMAAFSARHTYNSQFAFRTWLWAILLNLCRRHLRRKASRPKEMARSSLGLNSDVPFPEPTTSETGLTRVLVSEQRALLEALLDQLPEAQADALRLRFFGGLKFDEIASTMNTRLSNAKMRVHKGLLKLAPLAHSDQFHDSEGDTNEL